ncbi:MAG: membrane dipeptidase [Atribacterota bacterium]|nr:membrane dipeptidase [Atribacterota bacterium]
MPKEERYLRIHKEAIVFDACSPLAFSRPEYIDEWIKGGATAIAPTIMQWLDEMCHDAIRNIASFLKVISSRSDSLMQVNKVEDFYRAKEEKKLGMVFAFQSTTPLEHNLNLIELYQRLGLRLILLAYNRKNFVGDGCEERTDCGLSKFGIAAIKEMNRAGITIDCAHTGFRTTMEAIEVSEKPVIFSHANSRVVCNNPRNIIDEQAIAVAKKGGVIGVNGYPAFVAKKEQPTIGDLIDHIDHYNKIIGIDHIGIGMDYWPGQDGVLGKEEQRKMYKQLIDSGVWTKEAYPYAINYYPKDMEMPSKLPNLTKNLLARGYSEEDVKKILGLNFLRVFKETWKS